MSKAKPYEFCLECPQRQQCCRVTDHQPCSAMTLRLEQLERDYADGKFTTTAYGKLLVELLPGRRHGYGESVPPEHPTQLLAGSEEKIQLMRKRVSLGQTPCHPDDTRRRVCRRPEDDEDEEQ